MPPPAASELPGALIKKKKKKIVGLHLRSIEPISRDEI